MTTDTEFDQLIADYKAAHKSGDPEAIKAAREAINRVLANLQPPKPEPFHEDTVVEINVPSGKLIMSDDLREVAKYDIDSPISINYGRGCDALARISAEQANLAYAQVGNSCPSITVNTEGVIQFVSPEYDEDTNSVIFEDGEVKVGWIITDLWAVMAVDYQQWLDDGGKPVEEANAEYPTDPYTVLEVKPGKYRWTVFSHNDSFDGWADGRRVYAKLEPVTV